MNPELILFTDRRLREVGGLTTKGYTKIRRGAYYPTPQWVQCQRDQKHALLIHASGPAWQDQLVVSHRSAAALWGIPIVGPMPKGVEVTAPAPTRTTQGALVVHRAGEMPESVELNGFRVTSPLRTVLDLARTLPIPYALAAADHAVRNRTFTATEMFRVAQDLRPGARGRTMARTIACLADPRAESPLESLSRGVMFMNLLPKPDLQVITLGPNDEFLGRSDFGWPGVLGECDGAMKYGADLAEDGDPSKAVWQEKQREDRLREVSMVARWGWNAAYQQHGSEMLRILHAKGIRPSPSRRDNWLPLM
ncbi:hypothetical protein [Calidifontibacter terrae]